MKKTLFIMTVIMIVSFGSIKAQDDSHHITTIQVNGLMNVEVEQYTIMFNVIQAAPVAADAFKMIDSRILKLQAELESLGIPKTSFYSELTGFFPLFPPNSLSTFSSSNNEVPKGFEIHKTVTVSINQSGLVDKIILAAAKWEIYQTIKIEYYVSDIDAKIDSLRNLCMLTAKAKAHSFELLGHKLDFGKSAISEDISTLYPDQLYGSYSMRSNYSLSETVKPKKSKKSYGSVRTLNKGNMPEEKVYHTFYGNSSRYFNSSDYNSYEVIINPVVLSPVIQVKYNLSICFTE